MGPTIFSKRRHCLIDAARIAGSSTPVEWMPAAVRGALRDLTWRRVALTFAFCFVASTQLLFNPTLFSDWSLAEIAAGWLDHFFDILFTGACILVAVTVADNMLPQDSLWRFAGFLAAVAAASLAAISVLTAIHYQGSAYPDTLYLAGDMLRATLLGSLVAFIYELQQRNARRARRLQQIEIGRESLRRRMLEAELQVMQAQIEPHFLFNTLATVKRLHRTEPVSGARMLESLKHYLRAALPQFRAGGTTLGREFELARAYLDVLQIRMGERLRFSVTLPVELADVEFPSMMLITLVENAIKHGVGRSPIGGTIAVSAQSKEGSLAVRVADTGVGFQESSGSGIGLANIRSRLQALHGTEATLTLIANVPSGVVATIRVKAVR
jgi:hypothetical protein